MMSELFEWKMLKFDLKLREIRENEMENNT